MGDANAALAEVRTLRKVVSGSPALKSLEPELLYTEARIRGMQKSYKEALALYDGVVKTYPTSRSPPGPCSTQRSSPSA